MERNGTKTVERLEYAGETYRRTETESGEVEWELYNTGWGEHGWVPLRGHAEEEMETTYQNQLV